MNNRLVNLLPKIFQSPLQEYGEYGSQRTRGKRDFLKLLKSWVASKAIDKQMAWEMEQAASKWAEDEFTNGAQRGYEK